MNYAVLNVTDSQISLFLSDTIVQHYPVAAIVNENAFVLGREAKLQERLQPSYFFDEYIYDLNPEKIPTKNPDIQTCHDLIYRHFLQLQPLLSHCTILCLIPSYFTTQDCEFLGGIAQSAGITIDAMMYQSLLLARQQSSTLSSTVISTGYYSSTLDTIAYNGDILDHQNSREIRECGTKFLFAQMLKTLHTFLIAEHRIDIFNNAVLEQQLYHQLPQLYYQLDSELQIELGEQHLKNYSVPATLLRTCIDAWRQPIMAALADAENILCGLSCENICVFSTTPSKHWNLYSTVGELIPQIIGQPKQLFTSIAL